MTHKVEDLLPPNVWSYFLGKAVGNIVVVMREQKRDIWAKQYALADLPDTFVGRVDVFSYKESKVSAGIALEETLDFSVGYAEDALEQSGLSPLVHHRRAGGQTYHVFTFTAFKMEELDAAAFERGLVEKAGHLKLDFDWEDS